MVLDLYLFKNFNSYTNRYIKLFNNLEDYGEPLTIQYNVNFIENDYIDSTQHINFPTNELNIPDYLLCVKNGKIIYRYFILKAERTSANQLKLYLHRDVIADYYSNTLNSLCYVERGYVLPSNKLVFNSEGLSLNQIKTSETFIKDETNSPWIVAYVSKPTTDFSSISAEFSTRLVPHWSVDSLQDWDYYEFIDKAVVCEANRCNIRFYYKQTASKPLCSVSITSGSNLLSATAREVSSTSDMPKAALYSGPLNTSNVEQRFNIETNTYKQWRETLITKYGKGEGFVSKDIYDQFRALDGKILRVGAKYYRIAAPLTVKTIDKELSFTDGTVEAQLASSACEERGLIVINNESTYHMWVWSNQVTISLEELAESPTASGKVTYNSADLTEDASYNIICAPYSNYTFEHFSSGKTNQVSEYTVNKALNLAAILALAKANSAAIYDIQILPYCPLRNLVDMQSEGNKIDLLSIPDEYKTYFTSADSSTNIGVILTAQFSTFSFSINLEKPIVIDNPKVVNECDMWRLCSPNYNGVFEFNAAKNGGVRSFNIDCTYLPLNPWIHIAPDFDLLYGKDFNDARGLTLQGDFSVSRMSDRWLDYQAQNVNYQNSFNRQIENMETQYKYANISAGVNVATGAVTGALSGAMTGALLSGGNPIAGVVGAIGGGAASLAGGIADYHIQKQLQKEQLNFSTDMFNMQLGNIKALPNSLVKTTAFNANSKYFPFLEYYTCTEEERKLVENKIKYTGMALGIVDKIANYINYTGDWTFIQAKVLKSNEELPANILYEINAELSKGVYINGGN